MRAVAVAVVAATLAVLALARCEPDSSCGGPKGCLWIPDVSDRPHCTYSGCCFPQNCSTCFDQGQQYCAFLTQCYNATVCDAKCPSACVKKPHNC